MNILERFNEKKRIEQQSREAGEQQRAKDLANRIISALNDSETVESIENYLIERGIISITDFGCLCQESFCEWQKGLDIMLKPLIDEWKMKGIMVRLGLKLELRVESSSFPLMYNQEMTIEALKKWNMVKN